MHCCIVVNLLPPRTFKSFIAKWPFRWHSPSPGQVIAFSFVELMTTCQPTSWACPGPSEWCTDIWCISHPPCFVLSESALRLHSVPIIHIINEVLPSNGPVLTLGIHVVLVVEPYLGFEVLITSLRCSASFLFIPLSAFLDHASSVCPWVCFERQYQKHCWS